MLNSLIGGALVQGLLLAVGSDIPGIVIGVVFVALGVLSRHRKHSGPVDAVLLGAAILLTEAVGLLFLGIVYPGSIGIRIGPR